MGTPPGLPQAMRAAPLPSQRNGTFAPGSLPGSAASLQGLDQAHKAPL